MNYCPCCSAQLLRHVRHNRVYWFCSPGWQEMPVLDALLIDLPQESRSIKTLSNILPQQILMALT